MTVLISGSSTLANVLQLISLIIVFVIMLVAVYYTTRWLAKSGVIQPRTENISIVETYRVAPNRHIQIVKIGTKYVAIGVGKEEIAYLTELEEDSLHFKPVPDMNETPSFKDILKKLQKK